MKLPRELDFLHDYLLDPRHYYQKADWILNDFCDQVWSYSFSYKSPKMIDWRVRLNDDSLLTDRKNEVFLESLKSWLIASTAPYKGNGFKNSIGSQARAFFVTTNLIDYLLINDDVFQLYKFGLDALSPDDFLSILTKLCTSSSYSESLLDWPRKLIEFSYQLLDNTAEIEIERFISSNKDTGINEVSPEQEIDARASGIAPCIIPQLRAALGANGYIVRSSQHGFIPNLLRVSNEVFARSIRAKVSTKPLLSFLCYSDINLSHFREFSPVPVTTGRRASISPHVFRAYQRSLYSLGVLHELNLPAPSVECLVLMNTFSPEIEGLGRYRTLPSDIVFKLFRDSIELHFEHGRKILDGFLKLAIYSKKNNCALRDIPESEFKKCIGAELAALGVRNFSLTNITGRQGWKLPKDEHFESLRSNRGLLELVHIYFGAVQLVVGALSARRGGELKELKIGSATDNSGGWIIFDNRKSTRGLMGLRSTEARPIEPIAVNMLQEIERFHRVLNRIRFGAESKYIFCSPVNFPYEGRSLTPNSSYNRNFDLLCDYFETAIDGKGQRYYIRQHQLRRFFALLFFYGSSFGGLETLQWMLGHTDVRHVWHYITESMQGDVLRSAKSQYIAESLHRNGADNFQNLSDLIESRYGTTDFTLIDTEELEDYIADLIEEGDIEVEPEFFTDAEGEKFKVVVKVQEQQGAHE